MRHKDSAALAAPPLTEIVARIARPEDAGACAVLYAPFVDGSFISFEEAVPDAAEMRRRICAILEWTPWLCAMSGGEIVGYAYASRHRERAAYRWAVDVTAYVAKRFHGRGAPPAEPIPFSAYGVADANE